MPDLDEHVARAVAAPVAAPPDMDAIRRIVHRHRRRRAATRAAAVGGLVVVVGAIGIASVSTGSNSADVETRPATPTPSIDQPGSDPITRPLIDSCTATHAWEGRSTGTGHGDPDQTGEVFAVPEQGAEGPLAVVLRFPRANALSQQANVTVGGQPGRVDIGEGGQGGVTWLVAGGGMSVLYGRDLSTEELVSIADTITTGQSRLPMGLRSLGQSGATSWARSTCGDGRPTTLDTTVQVFHGSVASRYARLLAEPPGVRWDDGDTTFLVIAAAEIVPRPRVRQATAAEWDALLAAGP